MTVEKFASELGLKVVCMPEPDKEISGAYIGDLLSWVMGKAEPLNVWITIMSNINVVAVASLADVSCILLAESVTADKELLKIAQDKGVNILSTPLSAYDIAVKAASLIQ